MKRVLQDELIRRWPGVFRGRDRPLTQSLMAFGCECGDGWYPILDALCETLTKHAEELGREPPEAIQIKEKYASLRFYVDAADDIDYGAIWMAETLSFRICELTGAPGVGCVHGGYHQTLAPSIAERKGFVLYQEERSRRLPPVPSDEAADLLKLRRPEISVGTVEVAPGWFDLVDILLGQLDHSPTPDKPANGRVFDLRSRDGRLIIEFEGGRASDAGAIAFAAAMSTRIDPATGAAHVPVLE